MKRIPWSLINRTLKILRDAEGITAKANLPNLSAALKKTADEWRQHTDVADPARNRVRLDSSAGFANPQDPTAG